jgi:hypothetical protein
MNSVGGIIFATLCLLIFAYFCARTIWGDMAEKTYEARMQSSFRSFLMPGPLARKEVWIRSQRILAGFGLVFVFVVYLAVLGKIFGWI